MINKIRVNCYATCKKCRRAVFVRENEFGKKLYVCTKILSEHEEIDAKSCLDFRCGEVGSLCYTCRECNTGLIKQLKLY